MPERPSDPPPWTRPDVPPPGPAAGRPPGSGPPRRGTEPVLMVGIGLAGLLVVAVVVLGVVLVRSSGPDPVASAPLPPPRPLSVPTQPGTVRGADGSRTEASGTVIGPPVTAPAGGRRVATLDGRTTAVAPAGWEARATRFASGARTIGLSAPVDGGDFDDRYLTVTVAVREGSLPTAEAARSARGTYRRLGKAVRLRPARALVGARAEAWTIVDAGADPAERRTWLAVRDGREYEVETYGSPAANRRWAGTVEGIVASVVAR